MFGSKAYDLKSVSSCIQAMEWLPFKLFDITLIGVFANVVRVVVLRALRVFLSVEGSSRHPKVLRHPTTFAKRHANTRLG